MAGPFKIYGEPTVFRDHYKQPTRRRLTGPRHIPKREFGERVFGKLPSLGKDAWGIYLVVVCSYLVSSRYKKLIALCDNDLDPLSVVY